MLDSDENATLRCLMLMEENLILLNIEKVWLGRDYIWFRGGFFKRYILLCNAWRNSLNPLYNCPQLSARFSDVMKLFFPHCLIMKSTSKHTYRRHIFFGLVLGLKLEQQLLCETMCFGFTCRCMMWGCGCPSVVVIGNLVFGFTCTVNAWCGVLAALQQLS